MTKLRRPAAIAGSHRCFPALTGRRRVELAATTFPSLAPFSSPRTKRFTPGARPGTRISTHGSHRLAQDFLGLLIAIKALQRCKRATFVCDRVALLNQTSEAADSFCVTRTGQFIREEPH